MGFLRAIGGKKVLIGSAIMAVILVIVIFLVLVSPGVLPPLTDESGAPVPGALNEKCRAKIGGIRQGFFIRGETPDAPVLLFLHGGPGSPELPLIMAGETTERPEKYFTVCYWDQRGAGMTFKRGTDPATMTVGRMVDDTAEMAEYLIKRFGKSKIYLAGHSWGSYLGLKTVEKYPELFAAYVGIGQVSNQLESERIAYDFLLERSREAGDGKSVKLFAKFDKNAPDFPTNAYLMQARTPLMNKYGVGITHRDISMAQIALQFLLFRGYTVSDKLNLIAGMAFSLDKVFHYVTGDNLFVSSSVFKVPIIVAQGKYDYQVSYELAKRYVEELNAPYKEFVTFTDSAHSPNIEESALFTQLLRTVAAKHPDR